MRWIGFNYQTNVWQIIFYVVKTKILLNYGSLKQIFDWFN